MVKCKEYENCRYISIAHRGDASSPKTKRNTLYFALWANSPKITIAAHKQHMKRYGSIRELK